MTRNWDCLERFTALSRDATGSDALWENFGYLTVLSQDRMREHPSAYPKDTRRISLHNPWPIAPARASD